MLKDGKACMDVTMLKCCDKKVCVDVKLLNVEMERPGWMLQC